MYHFFYIYKTVLKSSSFFHTPNFDRDSLADSLFNKMFYLFSMFRRPNYTCAHFIRKHNEKLILIAYTQPCHLQTIAQHAR